MTKSGDQKPAGKPESARSGKKSETLEVRLPYETKRDFLDACRADGTTASEVVRQSIDGYLDTRAQAAEETSSDQQRSSPMNVVQFIPKPLRRPRLVAGALGAVGLAVFTALPSAANPDFRSLFDRLDVNGDGVLTDEEFMGPRFGATDSNPGAKRVIIEKRVIKRDENGEVEETQTIEHDGEVVTEIRRGQPIELSVSGGNTSEAYAYWLPSDSAEAAAGGKSVVLLQNQNEVRVTVDGDAANAATVDIRPNPFSAFDTDGDGKISYAEFEARQRTLLVNGFNRLDTDKNGSLSPEEYAAIGSPIVLQLAGNGGAKLPDDVLEKLKTTVPGMDPEATKAKSAERFATLDKNKDGKLSLQEYLPQ